MSIVELKGWEEEAADEALWDEQFARSQDVLEQMAKEAHDEYLAGLTEDFDPDNKPNTQFSVAADRPRPALARPNNSPCLPRIPGCLKQK